jgi:hypothetical protein
MAHTKTQLPLFYFRHPIRIEPQPELIRFVVKPIIRAPAKLAVALASTLAPRVYETLVEEHERRVPGVFRVPYREEHVRSGLEAFYRASPKSLFADMIEIHIRSSVIYESAGKPDHEFSDCLIHTVAAANEFCHQELLEHSCAAFWQRMAQLQPKGFLMVAAPDGSGIGVTRLGSHEHWLAYVRPATVTSQKGELPNRIRQLVFKSVRQRLLN